MHPLVSIAIPVYNGANYMREAIDSALNQTYSNIEVLVINDGSQDDGKTEEIALSYGDRVRYFSKPNGGVASALNLALSKASGDYFCWLSHDDLYLPEKVKKEIDLLLSLPDSKSVAYCYYSVINNLGKYLYTPEPPQKVSPRQIAYQLIFVQWLHCCTILAPKSLYLESGGFREDLPTTQDYDLLVKIALKYPFIELPEVLLKARSHSEQGSLTLGHRREMERFFEEHIPLLSPDYMQTNFTCDESINAFAALGKEMQKLGFSNAVLITTEQLLFCEATRAQLKDLWKVIRQLMLSDYPAALGQSDSFSSKSLVPIYKESTLKLMARRWLPSSAWKSAKRLRAKLRGAPKQQTQIIEVTALEKEATRSVASLNFDEIFFNNKFKGEESRSGEGSSMLQTQIIRDEIPRLLKELDIKILLDVPCGDWNWMRHVNLEEVFYMGGDIVQALIDKNNSLYGSEFRKFEYLNIIADTIPKVDLILCRDCLVHLNFSDGLAALHAFQQSGSKWLLTTTFTDRENNIDLYEGDIWRPLNLEKPPFNLPKPVQYINEECTEGNGLFRDKCLGLWKLK